ncbi:hypothetical protein HHL17_19545 [Chitinophaga sp. G-6-1-13]|uniref:Uncharacterized protein n=1 Tax=Chitinophaga fulva TaxID=2728842 RepID=A0A848GLY9_9BACT|nr:hypothetical protein [Chitinophaga fulva]NML39404.1 hypothetical protein [Chitinophaga fulva]
MRSMRYAWLLSGLLWACNSSQKIYTAPAIGAEAQFDKGLRPEKHPAYLFDKKTMKDLERQGVVSDYTNKRKNTAPTAPVKKSGGGEHAATDSTAHTKDSTGAILPHPADSAHTQSDSIPHG